MSINGGRKAVAMRRLHQDSGHHFGLAFGDYAEDLKELRRLAGFEVVTV